ncbi:hypothetical protein C8R46DRAFT_1196070 [Mycena filopes]|nr:hypothetical protein C8R46DRAFT_1196070 [Mycena filopes]
MPYSPPGVVAPPPPTQHHNGAHHTHVAGRPAHRRSYTFAVDDPRAGPGAFASLGVLPRRTRSSAGHAEAPSASTSSTSTGTAAGGGTRQNKFHFRGDLENEDSSSSSDEVAPSSSANTHPSSNTNSNSAHIRKHEAAHHDDEDDGPPPPLRFRLTPPTQYVRNHPSHPHLHAHGGHGGGGHGARSPPRKTSPNTSYTALDTALQHAQLAVPFPRSSPSPSASPTTSFSGGQASTGVKRPAAPARTSSTPLILLSNGKPLKSSLKSSSSAPHMMGGGNHVSHLRARSAPSTPSLALSPTSSSANSTPGSDASGFACALGHSGDDGEGVTSPSTPKAVHFPAPDSLEDVRLFKRGARPASVSFPLGVEGDETETETETDSNANMTRWSGGIGSNFGAKERERERGHGYPFPRVSPLNPKREEQQGWRYELDAPGIPREDGNKGGESMVVLEGVRLVGGGGLGETDTNELNLTGTLLARNAAFEKHVFVRFTLDGWCTTSEVGGRYVESLASFPSSSSQNTSTSANSQESKDGAGEDPEAPGPNWDRFAFSIRLTDYAGAPSPSSLSSSSSNAKGGNSRVGVGVGRGLEGRELVLVARFFAPWVGRGGVGPYVWCDTLTTPGHHAGAEGGGSSPSGRAWVGTGGGGSGEWWDNNGGRDYRVGFRVVPVPQEPAPTPAPTTTAPASTVPTPKNDIPFPTSDTSSPTVDTHAPVPAPPVQPLSITTQISAIPPPPPPRTAHAQALAAKLGRLSLRNYAAPSATARVNYVAPGARTVSFPSGPAEKAAFSTSSGSSKVEKVVEEKQESNEKKEEETKEESKEEKVEEKKEPERATGGVGLYWPWGRASAAAAPPTITTTAPSPSPPTTTPSPPTTTATSATASTPSTTAPADPEDDDNSSLEDDDLDDDAESGSIASLASFVRDPRLALHHFGDDRGEGEGEETPPTSPVGARGVLPDVQELGLGVNVQKENEKEGSGDEGKAAGVPLPESPLSTSPSSYSPTSGSPVTRSPASYSPTTRSPASYSPSNGSPLLAPGTPPLSPGAADHSSSLYKAFLKQWCFAGASGGAGAGAVGAKV